MEKSKMKKLSNSARQGRNIVVTTNHSFQQNQKSDDNLKSKRTSLPQSESKKSHYDTQAGFRAIPSLDKKNIGSYCHFFTKHGSILNNIEWIHNFRIENKDEKTKNFKSSQLFSFYEKDVNSWHQTKVKNFSQLSKDKGILKKSRYTVFQPVDVDIKGNSSEYSHVISKVKPIQSDSSQINFLYSLRNHRNSTAEKYEKEKRFASIPMNSKKTYIKPSYPPIKNGYFEWAKEIRNISNKDNIVLSENKSFSGKYNIKNMNNLKPFLKPGHATWETSWISKLRTNIK